MRKPALFFVVVAALIGLSGCSGAPSDGPETAAPPTVEEVEEAAPLTAEPELPDADAAFLTELRKRSDVTAVANGTDAQLIKAGHQACETLVTDPYVFDLQLIEGETPRDDGRYFESAVIGTHAQTHLCPEIEIVTQKIG